MLQDKTVWQRTDNPLFVKARESGKNIEVCDGDDINSQYIAVYCSSNGIYYPNNDATFIKRVVNQNKYDWRSNRLIGVRKHIYIRDIYKQWYVNGINDQIDSIEKIAKLIQSYGNSKTEFAFIGSSAGAYMAICLCTIIGGVVFAGSPQIKLPVDDKRNWLLLENQNDQEKSRYFDLTEHVLQSRNSEVFILFGKKNITDITQIKSVENSNNVYLLPFNTDLHGVVFWGFNAKDFLKKKEKMKQMSGANQLYSRISFSLKLSGLIKTIQGVMKQTKKSLKYRGSR